MQFILNKIIQNTKETLQVPSCADASARATVDTIILNLQFKYLRKGSL